MMIKKDPQQPLSPRATQVKEMISDTSSTQQIPVQEKEEMEQPTNLQSPSKNNNGKALKVAKKLENNDANVSLSLPVLQSLTASSLSSSPAKKALSPIKKTLKVHSPRKAQKAPTVNDSVNNKESGESKRMTKQPTKMVENKAGKQNIDSTSRKNNNKRDEIENKVDEESDDDVFIDATKAKEKHENVVQQPKTLKENVENAMKLNVSMLENTTTNAVATLTATGSTATSQNTVSRDLNIGDTANR